MTAWTENMATLELRRAMEFAEKMLRGSGEVRPLFVLHSEEEVQLMPAQWRSDEEKRVHLRAVRLLVAAQDIQAATCISEAWVSVYNQHRDETAAAFRARAAEVMPRDREDRREVVIVVVLWRDAVGMRHVAGETREIERNPDGSVRGLGSPSNPSADAIDGAMVDLMTPEPVSPEVRQIARAMLDSGIIGRLDS